MTGRLIRPNIQLEGCSDMLVGKRFCTVLGLVALLAAVAAPRTTYAVPTLQLDILGGVYIGPPEETIVTGADAFTVHAFATPGNVSEDDLKAETYFLSIAIRPKTSASASLGSFTVQGPGTIENDGASLIDGSSISSGQTIMVTGDMIFGLPPIGATANPLLGPHDVFETFFLEIEFEFIASDIADIRNTQDNPGEPLGTGSVDSFSFFAAFDVDMTNLSDDVDLHFDLYSMKVKRNEVITLDDFAPFSHDAESVIPEPASLVVWGLLALVGLCVGCRRRRRTA